MHVLLMRKARIQGLYDVAGNWLLTFCYALRPIHEIGERQQDNVEPIWRTSSFVRWEQDFYSWCGESETETRRSRIGTQLSVGPNTKKHLAWNGLSQ